MNKILLSLSAIVFLFVCNNSSSAQQDSMRTLPAVVIYSRTNVDKAVTDAFDKKFTDAMDQQWFKMNKNYLATFISMDMRNNAMFKQNGKLIYHISYGNEQQLPEDIRKQVKEAYQDYNITRAVNVKMNDRDVWMVNLEGMKKLLIVAAEDGELMVVDSYKKAS